ncbi:MAG: ABC transporter ATP-binding protein [Rhodospirillaceae bacterium]|nr:ABC transporter ATP-binding protein [Rhodospirillaceae bacterium]
MADTILSVDGLSKSFGALRVAEDISFSVKEGEILGIIGPNGAGKTTIFALLAGNLPMDSGQIVFQGQNISVAPAFERARLGMSRTYQVPKPFSHMSVFDNLKVAALFGGGLEEVETEGWIGQVMDLTGMTAARNILAGRLPLLLRKRHELARALATRPSILLVDEVAAGLTDLEVDEFINLIKEIQLSGITVIWIEHVMKTMLTATDRLMALAGGRVIAMGKPQEVITTDEVRRVYLGA